ncbi:ornithine carbamoyltransferase-like [Pectinophora gossypiella]|uniref:ornithine carbamoyltransferase-like n=1 Tax=Pectinophora gossypiella TaxID=13191 RepID=UPI00214E2AE1|nr:ornithine carbamoyltransferase-like [Pectinophora gossypiella]
MIKDIVCSAICLKRTYPDTHGIVLDTLRGSKIMILQEVKQPVLHSAVSKAATLLGASDVSIVDNVVWEHDYMGRVFSTMADAIFVTTTTHHCIKRFSEHSAVPVMCMHSRTHASIQALATIMTIMEEYGCMNNLNVGYLGPPHPVLNSFLLLHPMLGANFKYKCCCDKVPVTPLLFKASEDLSTELHTEMKACTSREEVFKNVNVIIAGPTTKKKEKLKYFKITADEIDKNSQRWYFIHICPRGQEVDDKLFNHSNARTYTMFDNMHYVAAAMMANAIIGKLFCY